MTLSDGPWLSADDPWRALRDQDATWDDDSLCDEIPRMIFLEGEPPPPGHPVLAVVYADAEGTLINIELNREILRGDLEDPSHWENTFKPALAVLRNMLTNNGGEPSE